MQQQRREGEESKKEKETSMKWEWWMRRARRLICDRLFTPLQWGGAPLRERCKVLIALMLWKRRSLTHNTWPSAPTGLSAPPLGTQTASREDGGMAEENRWLSAQVMNLVLIWHALRECRHAHRYTYNYCIICAWYSCYHPCTRMHLQIFSSKNNYILHLGIQLSSAVPYNPQMNITCSQQQDVYSNLFIADVAMVTR